VTRLHRPWLTAIALAVSIGAAANCGDVNAALAQLSEARALSADLLLQFTSTADAANRAVMADTDQASVTFAHEAERATAAAQKDVAALTPILQTLGYGDETRLLNQFSSRFADYRALDRRILDLAVENTNLKAQRMAFGPAQDAANAFRDALEALTPAPGKDAFQVEAIGAAATLTVREIQVLQAPHIADADEAVMTRRQALASLRPLVSAASRHRLDAAAVALMTFNDLNAQIISLSRRNTNVRSLALSLDQKRTLTASCEDSLHALQNALAKRGYTGIRDR